MPRCEWCKGAKYTEDTFQVRTQRGRFVEVQFNFCPVCGTDLRIPEVPEITAEEWEAAIKNLEMYIVEYASIGWTGQFALQAVLIPLRKRYENGERTRELYDAMMRIE